MNDVVNFTDIAAEMFLLLSTCVVMLAHLFVKKDIRHKLSMLLSFIGLIFTLIFVLKFSEPDAVIYTLYGHFVIDNIAFFFKIIILLLALAFTLYSFYFLSGRKINFGEYYALALFSILGMLILVSAQSFLIIFLGIELLSLPLYALVAITRNNKFASEAAIKYFIMGALATGIMLYGISIIYGLTASFDIVQVGKFAQDNVGDNLVILSLALVFIFAALAFKLGAAPFHMWTPDVYQGAPTSVALLVSTAPKVAIVAVILRLLQNSFSLIPEYYTAIILILACLSILIGNIIAIAQTSIKRLLAYSGIAHIGFMLLGLVAANKYGFTGSVFYIVIYAITTAGAFGILSLLNSTEIEIESLNDLKGLAQRNPLYAFLMLCLVLSMAGIPPLAGFYAKFTVFYALIAAGLIKTAVFALILSVVAAYYYLRIIKLMYFDKPIDSEMIVLQRGQTCLASFNVLFVVGFGLMPGYLLYYCQQLFVNSL